MTTIFHNNNTNTCNRSSALTICSQSEFRDIIALISPISLLSDMII